LSLTLREKHRVPRRIFGPKRKHVAEVGENGIMMSIAIYKSHKLLLELLNRGG
jgi:hypothetical protein